MNDIVELARLGARVGDVMLVTAFCGIRLFSAIAVLPAASEEVMPGSVGRAVVILLAFYISFGLDPDPFHTVTAAKLAWLAAKEALIGVMLGFASSVVFWVAESVGALIDMQAGYNMVQLQNPLSGQQSTPVSQLLLQLAVMTFWVLGGMLSLIGVLIDSFKVWPLLATLPSLTGMTDMAILTQLDELMRLVVKFSAPVLLVLVLIELGTGLVTRAADKLDPHSVSQPIKGAVTMLMLALLCGVFISQVRHFLLPDGVVQRLQMLLPSQD